MCFYGNLGEKFKNTLFLQHTTNWNPQVLFLNSTKRETKDAQSWEWWLPEPWFIKEDIRTCMFWYINTGVSFSYVNQLSVNSKACFICIFIFPIKKLSKLDDCIWLWSNNSTRNYSVVSRFPALTQHWKYYQFLFYPLSFSCAPSHSSEHTTGNSSSTSSPLSLLLPVSSVLYLFKSVFPLVYCFGTSVFCTF